VVDEVSMVRADLLDAVDARLREARADPRPFGGVQVVMVGDFLQLPPVVDDEAMDVLHGLGYRAPLAFCAHVMSRLPVTPVLLDRVYRQEERDFVEALARVRRGEDAAGAIALLNERCFRPHRDGRVPLLLTPTRAEAERHNRAGLAALSGSPTEYRAVVEGELKLDKDRLPAPELLVLKNGARVMAVQNDSQRRWVNGSLGTVTRLGADAVTVRFDSCGELPVPFAECPRYGSTGMPARAASWSARRPRTTKFPWFRRGQSPSTSRRA
jgi:hypothetical protein